MIPIPSRSCVVFFVLGNVVLGNTMILILCSHHPFLALLCVTLHIFLKILFMTYVTCSIILSHFDPETRFEFCECKEESLNFMAIPTFFYTKYSDMFFQSLNIIFERTGIKDNNSYSAIFHMV